MNETNIFFPAIALAFWSSIIWFALLLARRGLLNWIGLNSQKLSENIGRHFSNLFEMPVLFYALIGYVYAVHHVTALIVILSWLYVCLRIVHGIIHCTYNNISHRGAFWLMSNMVLAVLWGLFTLPLLS